MRWVYFILIILLVTATLIFILQIHEAVTMSFSRIRIRAPLAVLIAGETSMRCPG